MTAAVGVLEITLYCPGSFSLKDKRSITRGTINTLRRDFNVSVSILKHRDHHRLLTLGVAAVSTSSGALESLLQEVEAAVSSNPSVVLRETTSRIV